MYQIFPRSLKKNDANGGSGKRYSKIDLSVLSVSRQVWRTVLNPCSLCLILFFLILIFSLDLEGYLIQSVKHFARC